MKSLCVPEAAVRQLCADGQTCIAIPMGRKMHAGDCFWVKEAWQAIHVFVSPETGYADDVDYATNIPENNDQEWWSVIYRATDPDGHVDRKDRLPWRTAMHMPKWASRLQVEVIQVEDHKVLLRRVSC